MIVLCSEFLSDKTFETLQKYKIDYRKIKDLRVTSSKSVDKIKDYDKNLSSVINKIYCFKLVEFEKIFFIDADCIVCHNIDFMFEKYKDYDFCGTQCGLRISDTIKKHLDLLDKTFKRFKDTKGFDCYEFYASNLFICTPDNDIFNELEKDYKQGLIELHNDVP